MARDFLDQFLDQQSATQTTVVSPPPSFGASGQARDFIDQFLDQSPESLQPTVPDQSQNRPFTAADAAAEAANEGVVARLPWLSTAQEIGKMWRIYRASQRYQNGEANQEDIADLEEFIREGTEKRNRDETIGAKAVDIFVDLPASAIEFITTAGLFTVGKIATRKILAKTMGDIVRRRVFNQSIRKVGGAIGGAAFQSVVGMGHRGVANTINHLVPGMSVTEDEVTGLRQILMNEGDGFAEALAKGFGENFVEVGSERLGRLVGRLAGRLGAGIKGNLANRDWKLAIMRRWFNSRPNAKLGDFMRHLRNRAGWNGVIGEIYEERVSELGSGIINQNIQFADGDQIMAEAIAFSVLPFGQLITEQFVPREYIREIDAEDAQKTSYLEAKQSGAIDVRGMLVDFMPNPEINNADLAQGIRAEARRESDEGRRIALNKSASAIAASDVDISRMTEDEMQENIQGVGPAIAKRVVNQIRARQREIKELALLQAEKSRSGESPKMMSPAVATPEAIAARSRFRKEFDQTIAQVQGIEKQEAKDFLLLTDAVAEGWALANNRPMEDWYKENGLGIAFTPRPKAPTRTDLKAELEELTKESQPKPRALSDQDRGRLEALSEELAVRTELAERQALPKEEAARIAEAAREDVDTRRRQIIQGDSLDLVEGGLSVSELSSSREKRAKFYKGKPVLTQGLRGTIVRSVFGNVEVKLETGEIVKIPRSEVEPLLNEERSLLDPPLPALEEVAQDPESKSEPTIRGQFRNRDQNNLAKLFPNDVTRFTQDGDIRVIVKSENLRQVKATARENGLKVVSEDQATKGIVDIVFTMPSLTEAEETDTGPLTSRAQQLIDAFNEISLTDNQARIAERNRIIDITLSPESSERMAARQALRQIERNIFDQPNKGEVEFMGDPGAGNMRTVIRLFETGDVSTLIHELGHVVRRNLQSPDKLRLESWLRQKQGLTPDENGQWSTEMEETFALAFERFVREGKAPQKNLRDLFIRMNKLMSRIYKKATAINIKIDDGIRDVFDGIFRPGGVDLAPEFSEVVNDEAFAEEQAYNELLIQQAERFQAEGKPHKIGLIRGLYWDFVEQMASIEGATGIKGLFSKGASIARGRKAAGDIESRVSKRFVETLAGNNLDMLPEEVGRVFVKLGDTVVAMATEEEQRAELAARIKKLSPEEQELLEGEQEWQDLLVFVKMLDKSQTQDMTKSNRVDRFVRLSNPDARRSATGYTEKQADLMWFLAEVFRQDREQYEIEKKRFLDSPESDGLIVGAYRPHRAPAVEDVDHMIIDGETIHDSDIKLPIELSSSATRARIRQKDGAEYFNPFIAYYKHIVRQANVFHVQNELNDLAGLLKMSRPGSTSFRNEDTVLDESSNDAILKQMKSLLRIGDTRSQLLTTIRKGMGNAFKVILSAMNLFFKQPFQPFLDGSYESGHALDLLRRSRSGYEKDFGKEGGDFSMDWVERDILQPLSIQEELMGEALDDSIDADMRRGGGVLVRGLEFMLNNHIIRFQNKIIGDKLSEVYLAMDTQNRLGVTRRWVNIGKDVLLTGKPINWGEARLKLGFDRLLEAEKAQISGLVARGENVEAVRRLAEHRARISQFEYDRALRSVMDNTTYGRFVLQYATWWRGYSKIWYRQAHNLNTNAGIDIQTRSAANMAYLVGLSVVGGTMFDILTGRTDDDEEEQIERIKKTMLNQLKPNYYGGIGGFNTVAAPIFIFKNLAEKGEVSQIQGILKNLVEGFYQAGRFGWLSVEVAATGDHVALANARRNQLKAFRAAAKRGDEFLTDFYMPYAVVTKQMDVAFELRNANWLRIALLELGEEVPLIREIEDRYNPWGQDREGWSRWANSVFRSNPPIAE